MGARGDRPFSKEARMTVLSVVVLLALVIWIAIVLDRRFFRKGKQL
jgi:hypothetical protein